MSKSNSSTKRILSRCIKILTLLVALILFFIPTFNFYLEVSLSETESETNQEQTQEQKKTDAKEAGIQLWEWISLSPNSYAMISMPADESIENMNLYEIAGEILDEGLDLMNAAKHADREGDSAGLYVFSIIRIACAVALYFVFVAVAYSLLMSIIALFKVDIGGERLPFISKSADFMMEGLLIVWFIMIFASIIGGIGIDTVVDTGSFSEMGVEVTSLVRLVFVKVNYLHIYLILACVRIIGWFAFKRGTKIDLRDI